MADIMSETVEITANDAKPLVKVYTRRRLRELFKRLRRHFDRQAPVDAGRTPGLAEVDAPADR